jgi:hypothetical protein
MNENEWVVVTKVSGEFVGDLLRGLLEAQEIPVQLFNSGTGRAFGFSVGPLSEIEIFVPKAQENDAKQIIEQYESGAFDSPETND